MNFLMRTISCIVLLILTACTPRVALISPQAISECKRVCVQHLEYCNQNCIDNCPNCSAKADYNSTLELLKYVHEKKVRGGYIMRGLKSYRDPLQCRKVSCNCKSDYIICNQGCTGIVQKRVRPVPYCT